uniref:DUF1725 domain-containing protein n=1 Tax=Ursus maritimus TaxID=29073 RepID=A0A452UVZ5_URSMA
MNLSLLIKKLKIELSYNPVITLLGLLKKYKSTNSNGYMHLHVYCTMSAIAKLWKEPRCPSTDEGIKKMWYIYTMEYHSAIKKNEILPFAMVWMELEGIMLNEIRQSEKDNYHMISFICGI